MIRASRLQGMAIGDELYNRAQGNAALLRAALSIRRGDQER
jgi:hypothetical protein